MNRFESIKQSIKNVTLYSAVIMIIIEAFIGSIDLGSRINLDKYNETQKRFQELKNYINEMNQSFNNHEVPSTDMLSTYLQTLDYGLSLTNQENNTYARSQNIDLLTSINLLSNQLAIIKSEIQNKIITNTYNQLKESDKQLLDQYFGYMNLTFKSLDLSLHQIETRFSNDVYASDETIKTLSIINILLMFTYFILSIMSPKKEKQKNEFLKPKNEIGDKILTPKELADQGIEALLSEETSRLDLEG